MSGGPELSCDHRTAMELKLQVVSESFSIFLNLLVVFKSPVLWTGKKLDLDQTEPKKTGLSVVVCHSFKRNRLQLRDLWGKKKTSLDRLGPVQTDFIMYTYLATITE